MHQSARIQAKHLYFQPSILISTIEKQSRMQALVEKISEAIDFLKPQIQQTPRIGLILGTGLGDFSQQIQQQASIAYEGNSTLPSLDR